MDQPTEPTMPRPTRDEPSRGPTLPPEVQELRALIAEVRGLLDTLAAETTSRA